MISIRSLSAALALFICPACITTRMQVAGDPVQRVPLASLIPAIDEPTLLPAREAERFMDDDEPVLGILDGDRPRAYSLWMLDRHEIVNDRLSSGPITVTW